MEAYRKLMKLSAKHADGLHMQTEASSAEHLQMKMYMQKEALQTKLTSRTCRLAHDL
jgi:hypothetical protein